MRTFLDRHCEDAEALAVLAFDAVTLTSLLQVLSAGFGSLTLPLTTRVCVPSLEARVPQVNVAVLADVGFAVQFALPVEPLIVKPSVAVSVTLTPAAGEPPVLFSVIVHEMGSPDWKIGPPFTTFEMVSVAGATLKQSGADVLPPVWVAVLQTLLVPAALSGMLATIVTL